MARDTVRRNDLSRSLAGWRAALASVLLIAFAFQTYVTQTHIHLPPANSAGLSPAIDAPNAKSVLADRHTHFPGRETPTNCPICQEFLQSGQFVTPSAQILLPPTLMVSTIALVESALPFVPAISHSWRGRAPPLS